MGSNEMHTGIFLFPNASVFTPIVPIGSPRFLSASRAASLATLHSTEGRGRDAVPSSAAAELIYLNPLPGANEAAHSVCQ